MHGEPLQTLGSQHVLSSPPACTSHAAWVPGSPRDRGMCFPAPASTLPPLWQHHFAEKWEDTAALVFWQVALGPRLG